MDGIEASNSFWWMALRSSRKLSANDGQFGSQALVESMKNGGQNLMIESICKWSLSRRYQCVVIGSLSHSVDSNDWFSLLTSPSQAWMKTRHCFHEDQTGPFQLAISSLIIFFSSENVVIFNFQYLLWLVFLYKKCLAWKSTLYSLVCNFFFYHFYRSLIFSIMFCPYWNMICLPFDCHKPWSYLNLKYYWLSWNENNVLRNSTCDISASWHDLVSSGFRHTCLCVVDEITCTPTHQGHWWRALCKLWGCGLLFIVTCHGGLI